jgi:hypothetical protein
VSLRLRALELHVPARMSRTAIDRLFEATASAFGRSREDADRLDRRALLARYIAFTAACADETLKHDADVGAVSCRLWRNAFVLGRLLRRGLGIRTRDAGVRAARVVYGIIGIDFQGDRSGTVAVDCCPFAVAYSPRTCRLMSSLDAGLIAGLTDGGRLEFSERITEGRPRCLARITWTEGAA